MGSEPTVEVIFFFPRCTSKHYVVVQSFEQSWFMNRLRSAWKREYWILLGHDTVAILAGAEWCRLVSLFTAPSGTTWPTTAITWLAAGITWPGRPIKRSGTTTGQNDHVTETHEIRTNIKAMVVICRKYDFCLTDCDPDVGNLTYFHWDFCTHLQRKRQQNSDISVQFATKVTSEIFVCTNFLTEPNEFLKFKVVNTDLND